MVFYGIGAGDGNSIFEIASTYEKMQLREIQKSLEEMKNRIKTGVDTGSIRFTDDISKLNGLFIQLKVKTGFDIVDDMETLIEARVSEILSANDFEAVYNDLLSELNKETTTDKTFVKYFTEYEKLTNNEEKLTKLTALSNLLNDYEGPPNVKGEIKRGPDFDIYNRISRSIESIKTGIRAQMTDIASRDTFNKLSRVSDTIPNLINQILALSVNIQRNLKKNTKIGQLKYQVLIYLNF